jgi:hypothetical protein
VSQPPQSRILAGLVMQLEAVETTPRDTIHLGSWMLQAQAQDAAGKGQTEPLLALAPAGK